MNSVYWADLGRYAVTRIAKLCSAQRVFVVLLWIAVAAAADDGPKPASLSWAPPDIDRVFAPVNIETPCMLGEVLRSASHRVQDLVVNMQRFSATEQVVFDEVDGRGALRASKKATFSYVAYVHETAPQQLAVEEYRDDSVALQDFPSKLATLGTAAFALIFHPNYLKDFAVTCEGLTDWQGRRAWRLHLAQVQANNFRGYRLANRYFRVMLKARAWIDAETFEVLRLETDLRDPIAEIPLLLEHVIVEYAMVEFPRRNLRLWLPREAEIYMDYRGHRYHHRHSFSHFQLFWVDTEETVKSPQMAAAEPSYPPANTTKPAVVELFPPRKSAASEPQPPPPNVMANAFEPAVRRDTAAGEQRAPIRDTPAKPVFEPAITREAVASERPASSSTAMAKSLVEPRDTAGTEQRALVPNTAANPLVEPAITRKPGTSERPAPFSSVIAKSVVEPTGMGEAAASERARWQNECPDCLRVLISQRDGETGQLKDNWRTQAQDNWIKQNTGRMLKGKGLKIRITSYRENADYNIIWSVGFVQATPYTAMRAEVTIHDIDNGKDLFHTLLETRYWEVEHPENKCLQDAISFLQNGQKASHGYVFSHW